MAGKVLAAPLSPEVLDLHCPWSPIRTTKCVLRVVPYATLGTVVRQSQSRCLALRALRPYLGPSCHDRAPGNVAALPQSVLEPAAATETVRRGIHAMKEHEVRTQIHAILDSH